MAELVHLCGPVLSGSEILLMRGLVGVFAISFFCRRSLLKLFSKSAKFIWFRALFGGLSIYCYFWTIQVGAPGVATVLSDLSPVFVIVFSSVLFRVEIPTAGILGVFVAMAGVIGIGSFGSQNIGFSVVAIGILGAMLAGAAYLSMKQATEKFSPLLIVWALSISLVFISALEISDLREAVSHICIAATSRMIFPFAGAVVAGIFSQILMTYSYKHLSATSASTLGLTASIWAIFVDSILGLNPTNAQLIFAFAALFGILLCLKSMSTVPQRIVHDKTPLNTGIVDL
jgi:drug/metabolite transporter (DMT)-like permease